MYPRNAASPEPVAIGAVIQISDGAVQTSGVTVRIKPIGVAEADGGGTTAYSTDGIILYTPTQAETNYTSFILIAKKTGCIPTSVTVVTSASATAGYAGTDQGKIANPTSTVALTGTTIATTQKVDVETIKTNPVVNAGTVTFPTGATLASTTNITAGTITTVTTTTTATNVTTVNGLAAGVITAASIAADAITAASIADGAIDAATFAAGAINAAAIAADAITDAKVASDVTIASVTGAVGSVTGAVGSVTGNVGGNVTGSVGSVATGGIAAASFAAGAITAAAIATDAIDADALAADAVTEIQSGLATAANLATVAGYIDTEVAAILAAVDTEVGAIKTVTDAIGATGSGLSAIPWNAAWDAEVQSECADALNAYDPPTNTEMVAAFTEIKGATWATTDTLEAIRDRGDAAWTTATGFSTLTAADVRSAVGLGTANLDTQLAAIDDYLDTEVAAIKAKTDLIPASPAATGDIPSANTIADTVLGRSVSNIEGSAAEHSLCSIVLATLESSISGTTWTLRKTDGSTTYLTKTLTTDAAADPITGVA